MARVQFYDGPYCGMECDIPFLPTLLVGHQMDGDSGVKANGKFAMDTTVNKYIYQLTFPNGENEPFEYRLRKDYPDNLYSWIGADIPPKTHDDH